MNLHVVHEAAPGPALAGNDDDVVRRMQSALPEPLLEDQIVGSLELIEGVAHPAHVLGAAPGAIDSDSRQGSRMSGHIGLRLECDSVQTKRFDLGFELLIGPA